MGKKRRVLWIVGGLATMFALFTLLASVASRDSVEADVERLIAEHSFVRGVSSGQMSQLSHTAHSIDYYSISEATAEQEEAAFDSLGELIDGWHVRNENEFGAVYVNDRKDSMVYSLELRRESVVQAGLVGTRTKQPGPALLLAVERDEPAPASLWQMIKGLWPW